MEYAERTRIINRLLLDRQKIGRYTLLNPTAKHKYLADEYYLQILDEVKYQNWLNEEESIAVLISTGILPRNYKQEIESLEKSLENYKMDLFQNRTNPGFVRKQRELIRAANNRIAHLNSLAGSLFSYTIEGFALSLRSQFLLAKTLYLGKKRVRELSGVLDEIMAGILEKRLTIPILKELARTEPWRGLWACSKPNPFSHCPTDFTDEQTTLIQLSMMYDNVYQSPDCPEDMVINDDDMLDGWFLVQKKKREEKDFKDIAPAKHNEVFIPAQTAADVAKIQGMNSIESKIAIKQRESVLNKKGQATDLDFPDVQNRLLQEQANGQK